MLDSERSMVMLLRGMSFTPTRSRGVSKLEEDRRGNKTRLPPSGCVKNGRRKEGREGEWRLGRMRVNMGISEKTRVDGESMEACK